MRPVYKRFSVISGFTVLLIVLVINNALTRRQLAVQNNNQEWVAHTQTVLLELTAFESLMKDAETGQRGYLYTGDPRYLEPYNNAIAQGPAHLDRLAELMADNPGQQARVARLRLLKQQKLEELGRTIRAFDEGDKEQARSIVLSGSGKAIMDQIRAITAEMRREESSLEASRLQQVDDSRRSLVGTLYFTMAVAAIGLALLAFYIVSAISERERHEAQLRQSEEWFRVTLSSIGDAVIATDAEGKIIFENPVAEGLTLVPLAQARGRTIQEIFPIFNEQSGKPVENPVAKVLESERTMELANHTVLQRGDGTIIPIEDSAAPIFDDREKLRGVVMVFRDVTAEKKLRAVLHKAEKLAAAGRLAATVAHEINNPLEAVGNLIFLVKHIENLPVAAHGYLVLAEQELSRVSHITRQTLGFYRDTSKPGAVDLREIVRSVLRLYENKLQNKDVAVEFEGNECSPVHGLPGELQQVVANLISNAADAVPAGGRIKVLVRPASSPSQDEGVELVVVDGGDGVPQEHRAQVFEPFFTTKKDIGTGLGLWVSKEIVERHGGTLTLGDGTEDGLRGALFTIFLPCRHVESEIQNAGSGSGTA